jgi:hypothetical protein
VTAQNMDGAVSGISNTGANVAIVAPGEQIYSLHSKDAEWQGPAGDRERLYIPATGTSFSAPIVAGVASLLLAKSPGLPNRLIEDIILNSSGSAAWDPAAGAGLLNANRVMTADLSSLVTVRPTEVVVRRDKKKVSEVDVFGIVRGMFTDYRVDLGKGRQPGEWQPVAGAATDPVEYGLICRISGEQLSKGKEWTVRVTATDAQGRPRVAYVPVNL